jgi:hypothetical protein
MDKLTKNQAQESEPSPAKKPYTAPSFQFESVFEISALACGKIAGTQSGCRHSRKAS